MPTKYVCPPNDTFHPTLSKSVMVRRKTRSGAITCKFSNLMSVGSGALWHGTKGAQKSTEETKGVAAGHSNKCPCMGCPFLDKKSQVHVTQGAQKKQGVAAGHLNKCSVCAFCGQKIDFSHCSSVTQDRMSFVHNHFGHQAQFVHHGIMVMFPQLSSAACTFFQHDSQVPRESLFLIAHDSLARVAFSFILFSSSLYMTGMAAVEGPCLAPGDEERVHLAESQGLIHQHALGPGLRLSFYAPIPAGIIHKGDVCLHLRVC
eukprot:1161425-Pelagomonas_calceolata.AAC.5